MWHNPISVFILCFLASLVMACVVAFAIVRLESKEKDSSTELKERDVSDNIRHVFPKDKIISLAQEELDTKIAKADELIENIKPIYTVVAPPANDMKHWSKIAEILESPDFQWIMFAYRNELTASFANDIQDDKRFLTNLDQVAGGIKTIDNLMLKMRKLRDNVEAVLEAEKNGVSNDEI